RDQRAAPPFVAREPGGSDARRAERLVDRDALLRMPRVASVDRSPHARPDTGQRIELLDRSVGAVGDDGTGGEKRLERVGAVGLAGPEAIGEVAIRRGMRELNRARDAELREPLQVFGREQLAVLDAVTEAE